MPTISTFSTTGTNISYLEQLGALDGIASPTGGSGPSITGAQVAGIASGVASIAVALLTDLPQIPDFGQSIIFVQKQAEQNRVISRGNAKRENTQTELSAFRLLKTQLAQSAAGGFSVQSGSTRSILRQTENDKDTLLINRNSVLINELKQIKLKETSTIFNIRQAEAAALRARKRTKFGRVLQVVQGVATIAAIVAVSDIRLKTNINKVGVYSKYNLPIYTYNYIWGGSTQIGFMAQDVLKVLPDAVIEIDGFYAVNYSKVLDI